MVARTAASMNTLTTRQNDSHLIAAASNRPGDDPIFALHGEAVRRAAEGEDILNATLGALVEDDGSLCVMPSVFEAFTSVDPVRAAAYAPISGDKEFLEGVLEDVFGGDRELAVHAVANATAGGTGALHHSVVNFLEPGQSLLTTDFYWSPYRIIAEHTGRKVNTFRMFDSKRCFDLSALEVGLSQQMKTQGRALLVLNFPCHNPTGYSLDSFEWQRIVEILNAASSQGPVAICLDLAYARYATPPGAAWVEAVKGLAPGVTLLVAWSASKSYAQYGARVGALVAVVRNQDQRERIKCALQHSSRGTWSNCNHLGLLAIANLLQDADLRSQADRDRARLVRLLSERVAAFNGAARTAGLDFPRYEGGFFVTVFTPHARKAAAICREDGVFVVPLDGGLRLALCATPVAQVARLVKSLAHGIQSAGGA
ncbi:MAG TPA: aminotransferase class I/II-fold pyridoxal phosphate-dependent enzyme [Planctomycetes bacterium]|nr:aminotransferase class I/II-fold pyridoxal phosphate-dependent enzyme [Planctomycetota bacterium]HIL37770.1 aminotransferase class I/II-fold pyridoxal phosphate-dependent enzyme [Planctomycetota bacterium]